ncbi:MAG: dienelactone hydrolase family protein [Proteobacteria bacterium]|nr:dienelactone hydrolase family protein [Pseudomonadota bacterium]
MTDDQEIVRLSGPAVDPANGRKPRQLVMFCHGVGSDGEDLIGLAPYCQRVLPDARFVAPNAPFPFESAPFGYQWFSLNNAGPDGRLDGARMAAPILNAFIDAELGAHGLTDRDLALVGFSQGAMMCLHVGLRRPKLVAGVLAYSGMLVGPDVLESEIRAKPPVLLCHGQADEVVPFDFMPAALEALRGVGVRAEGLGRPGLGHGLDDDGIKAGMFFLADCFGIDLQGLK